VKSLSLSAQKGFTLIELLVVIAIIGILAAAAVPQILDAICNSRGTAAQSEIATIRTAVVQCQTMTGCDETSLDNMANNGVVTDGVADDYVVNDSGNAPRYETADANVVDCDFQHEESNTNGDELRYYSGNGEFEAF